MCYSAMVEQDAKRLARQFDAEIQTILYAGLFHRRLEGEKLSLNKAMELPFLHDSSSMEEKAIAKNIRAWHANEVPRLQAEIEKQTERHQKAKEALKKKETKKALEEERISKSKISKAEFDLKRHKSEDIVSESEERIFPFHYASVLCAGPKKKNIVMPFRYLMRPHDEDESFDRTHGGCYNARFNKLTLVPFWKDSLVNGRRGVMVVRKFYENVPTEDYLKNKKLPADLASQDNIVVCFEPKGVKEMYIPVLWDCWKKKDESTLYSAALITDDPPPEVQAAGHDRCPIFLEASAIEDWLHSDLKSGNEIKETILSRREKPFYDHKVMGATA